jgi:hypothetical protein
MLPVSPLVSSISSRLNAELGWLQVYWLVAASATFVLLSCLDGLVCRKSRSAELERDVEVNPLVSGTWRVGAAERLKISVCGPILVPVRIVSLLGCSLLAVLFCTLALLGFKDNCKQVRTMRESAIWLVQCQFRRPG